MASSPQPATQEPRDTGLGKSLLELAPLELECMNTLWPLGEGTVRDIQQQLVPVRPRAYTTIMTIMDRLAHKGVVTRRKSGRAWLYRPNLSAQDARTHAVDRLVEGFFDGSPTALAAHLSASPGTALASQRPARPVRPARSDRPRVASGNVAAASSAHLSQLAKDEVEAPEDRATIISPTRLDASLL